MNGVGSLNVENLQLLVCAADRMVLKCKTHLSLYLGGTNQSDKNRAAAGSVEQNTNGSSSAQIDDSSLNGVQGEQHIETPLTIALTHLLRVLNKDSQSLR